MPRYQVYAHGSSSASGQLNGAVIYMDDGEATLVRTSDQATVSNSYAIYCTMYLGTTTGDLLLNKGHKTKVVIQNIYTKMAAVISGTTFDLTSSIKHQVHLVYMDGTTEYDVETDLVNNSGGYTDLSVTFEPKEEVQKIVITYYVNFKDTNLVSLYNGASVTSYITFGEENADKHYQLTFEQQSEEAGLLEGVITWLKDIWESITDLGQFIKDLPGQIWGFIENGLKSLFVPDEAFIVSYKQKWEELLSSKLGAVWQVVEVTFGSWEDINVSDEQNTIAIPEVSIPLPENNSFSFGPYDVKIVPDGFEFLATAIKAITGILSTFMFINGVRKRYDEIMGVEQ